MLEEIGEESEVEEWNGFDENTGHDLLKQLKKKTRKNIKSSKSSFNFILSFLIASFN